MFKWTIRIAIAGVIGSLIGFQISKNNPEKEVTTTTKKLRSWDAQKHHILSDYDEKIGDDFDVPPGMENRVGFWFDIYTRYDGWHKVVHHSLYPWVIYEVVDVTNVKNPDALMRKKVKYYKNLIKGLKTKTDNYTYEEKRILELFASATDPMKAYETAETKIRYQTGQRDALKGALVRSQPFMDHMEDIFEQEKMPVELTRIPFLESSFRLNAYSRVGASGVWQFMRRTGRKFLKINRVYDERMSPLKATHAAAQLLRQNHKITYKSWPLAVTAYNHGPSGLRRAVRKLGTPDLAIIVEEYKGRNFSFASGNFYSSFLAVLHAERYRKLVFPEVKEALSPPIQAIELELPRRGRDIASALPCDEDLFLTFNPDLKKALDKNLLLPKGTKYFVPLVLEKEADSMVAVNE